MSIVYLPPFNMSGLVNKFQFWKKLLIKMCIRLFRFTEKCLSEIARHETMLDVLQAVYRTTRLFKEHA